MKAILNQNVNRMGLLLANSPLIYQDIVWTNTPNTIKHIRFENRPGEYIIYLTIKGLMNDNFNVHIAGNILMIVLEKKREFVIASSWGSRFQAEKSEKRIYSTFERSDVFLPGDSVKHLKSARYIDNELVIKIGHSIKEVSV
jgi:hypothetical protein